MALAYQLAFGREPTEPKRGSPPGSSPPSDPPTPAKAGPIQTDRALVDLCQAIIGMNEFIYIP